MKAVFIDTKKEVYLEDIETPRPQKGEVLIRIKYTGICGSDLHYFREGRVGDNIIKAPHILGHESSGEIVELGADVTGLNVGDLVTIEPGVPCLHCDFCRKGQYNLCDKVKFLGAPPFYGTFREYISHSALFTYKLPEGISLRAGALVEPLAVGYNAVSKINLNPSKEVLITGAGPIGIAAMLIALQAGAKVTITDVNEYRLQIARSFGVDLAVNMNSSDIESNRFDYAIEASGNVSTFPLIMKGIKKSAHVVLVGMTSNSISLHVNSFLKKECVLHGIYRYVNDFQPIIKLLSSGRINTDKIISHEYKLDELLEALKFADNPAFDKMKVMVSV